jgi:hypothetical protein
VVDQEFSGQLIGVFLQAGFTGAERHGRRLAKITVLESGQVEFWARVQSPKVRQLDGAHADLQFESTCLKQTKLTERRHFIAGSRRQILPVVQIWKRLGARTQALHRIQGKRFGEVPSGGSAK